jgi:hypothetical protein
MRDTISKFERFRSDTTGFVDGLMKRQHDLSAREDALAQRERVVADLMGKAAHLLDRIDRRIADSEKFETEPIATPPSMGTSPGEPRDPDNDEATAPLPGGELHVIEAKDGEVEDPDLDDPDNTDLEPVLADQGNLPPELAHTAPLHSGNYPTLGKEEPKKQVPQPISVSLW